MSEKYAKDCFKKVNAALRQNKCQEHKILEPIGDRPYIESVKLQPVGSKTEAEFRVRFPSDDGDEDKDAHTTMVMHFDNGRPRVGSTVQALSGGSFLHKRGVVRDNSLGWYVDWED